VELQLDDTTVKGKRYLLNSDSGNTTRTYDPNLRTIMVDDPTTGRRPAITIKDLFDFKGDHRNDMIDDLTNGRRPIF
jgi:hypothetical protein